MILAISLPATGSHERYAEIPKHNVVSVLIWSLMIEGQVQ